MKNLKISTIDSQGKISGEEKVSLVEFDHFPLALVSQAVKAFLANQRRARAKAKTRAQVEGSKSKIYRQKGTGRARHGDRQAPIFVGGGKAHGPTGRQNYKQKLNQKMSRQAILAVLTAKVQGKKLFLAEDFNFKKTKLAAEFVTKTKENLKTEKIDFILSAQDTGRQALKNLPEVNIFQVEALSPYWLLKTDALILSKSALEKLTGKETHA